MLGGGCDDEVDPKGTPAGGAVTVASASPSVVLLLVPEPESRLT